MNLRAILLLAVAVVSAVVTVVYARSWIMAERAALRSQAPREEPRMPTSQVLVSKVAMVPGRFVKADDLVWHPWPAEGVREEYVTKDGPRKIEDLVGAVARLPITPGEPVTAARLVLPGDRGFLAAVLIPGMRAVSVPVTATTGISGFVFPGDRVDLVLSAQTKDADESSTDKRHYSLTLLAGVRVLAVDQKTERRDGEVLVSKTATLEVTPKQAEVVVLGLQMGGLSLSLQSLAAEEQEGRKDGGALRLAGGADPIAASRQPLPSITLDREISPLLFGKRQVNVLRGSKAELVSF